MTRSRTPKDPKHYVVGIDVGSNSVGLSAIELDSLGSPVALLSAISQIHDSGVLEAKTATTRLAAAGVARRVRRMRRKRVKRLTDLDRRLAELGWLRPDPAQSSETDPYAPWRARARLSGELIDDAEQRGATLAMALRHMARHRGWRNPYVRASQFYSRTQPSEFFLNYRERVEGAVGRALHDGVTVAELAIAAIDHDRSVPLRMGKTEKAGVERPFSYLGGKLMQSDNANELHAWAQMQGLDEALLRELIDLVFAADSPRGSWLGKIGKDPLDPTRPRSSKASDSFQRFRIVSVLANVRVRVGSAQRPLTLAERRTAYDWLLKARPGSDPTWAELAKQLGLPRGALTGTAALDDRAEERLPLRPPVHGTDHTIQGVKKELAAVRAWWAEADMDARDALVDLLTDGRHDESTSAGVAAWQLLDGLDEVAVSALDGLDLPSGRGAYSTPTLRRLTERMLSSTDDLHAARKAVFGVNDSWTPPAEPIGAPVGNPAVDRVTKIVARWLQAAEAEWGAPQRVTIEHVREAFLSEAAVRERDREMRRRFDANERDRLALKGSYRDGVGIADVRRYQAIARQKGQCAYCGETITLATSELDHIVPRKGSTGSVNTRTNLLAVCVPCNRSKTNKPFAVWAESSSRPGVSVPEAVARTKFWTRDPGFRPRSWRIYVKEVQERLARTDKDPEIDARSLESVAWMANELRDRVAAHYPGSKVSVYQGAVTAGAREAAGIADKIPFLGGGGKTRLDRRHHAVDAATVALLDESIARTLAERNNMRATAAYTPAAVDDWRTHRGRGQRAVGQFETWRIHMEALSALLACAFEEDRVIVMENLRLRLGDGKVHEDTVHQLARRQVGGPFTRTEIDAAATPALWTALVRDPGYDAETGLLANPRRTIRVHGTHFGPDDEIEFFDKPRAAVAVRGGWAQLGDIHHARIYRWVERGRVRYGMLRVFTADLVRHRHEDLFSVEPAPSWISMRVAHPSVGRADLSTKEYLGWLVSGDEILVPEEVAPTAPILGPVRRWKVRGFEDATRINLEPLMLAEEGLEQFAKRVSPGADELGLVRNLVAGRARYSVSKFFADHPVIIRRDALGRPRLQSSAGLPTSWQA